MDKISKQLGSEPAVINKPNAIAKEYADKATKRLIRNRERDAKCLDYFSRNSPMTFSIEPMPNERQRLDKPMTDAERALRKQWVMDQKLSPNEPRHVPELHGERQNFVRQMWHKPFNMFEKVAENFVGTYKAKRWNWHLRKFMSFYLFAAGLTFYYQYTPLRWSSRHGTIRYSSRLGTLPGDPEYGNLPKADLDDFFDHGFKKRTVLLPKA